ncbi:hydrogenase formation protein HypD [Coprobacter tertius]|uniref:Hydrogenase formation protein HypD n=1 Tax=Coprobacter tertius TaxID=2944915 RepID=A0ABT1MIC2_9BACT|nr:hydrogenase formation protein HypD [Coprobacter tertius]MCP9612119.1 hydrogenase formation protein HypD [Coprobacter tertius]
MNFDKNFRDPQLAQDISDAIKRITKHPWQIMEICGGQTHSLAKYRIEELLPKEITLVHGPGCPVCVTPIPIIDCALDIARRKNTIMVSFGDMLRVPGSKDDLLTVKAEGADIRIAYSPLDTLKTARENPEKEVVFFAIGFETTAPLHALTIAEAEKTKLKNFSIISSLFTVPPAIRSILHDKDCLINGILAAGHVCTITGLKEYHKLAKEEKIPITVTGFEPIDLLYGIYTCIQQLETNTFEVHNAYKRAVSESGNISAQNLIQHYFQSTDAEWRGLGTLPKSGLRLRSEYEQYDAIKRFHLKPKQSILELLCVSGEIMRGKIQPTSCRHFGHRCTPEHPLGAAMVSSEGTCAAFYRYKSNI